MDLQTIHAEIMGLRKDVQRYHAQTVANKTDIVWIKRALMGGFTFIFTVLGGVIVSALS
jgi:hypothetical protein